MDPKTAIFQLRKIKEYNTKDVRLAGEKWDENWKTLIAIIMSAQTRDIVTIKVCDKLFNKYNSLEKISKASLAEIEKEIKSVNYYKTKSKNILEISKIILQNGIPKTIEELIKLPGVGRKTANVFLSEAFDIPAIGVDTHVFRISKKLSWSNGNTPEKVEYELKKMFHKKHWNEINNTLVKFGQTHSISEEDKIIDYIKSLK